jgi:hypothetical protein
LEEIKEQNKSVKPLPLFDESGRPIPMNALRQAVNEDVFDLPPANWPASKNDTQEEDGDIDDEDFEHITNILNRQRDEMRTLLRSENRSHAEDYYETFDKIDSLLSQPDFVAKNKKDPQSLASQVRQAFALLPQNKSNITGAPAYRGQRPPPSPLEAMLGSDDDNDDVDFSALTPDAALQQVFAMIDPQTRAERENARKDKFEKAFEDYQREQTKNNLPIDEDVYYDLIKRRYFDDDAD